MKTIFFCTCIFLLFCCTNSPAQDDQKVDSTSNHFSFYAGITHQHQNFYSVPFSFTGIEASVIINNNIPAEIYVSSFLSVLNTGTAQPVYLQLWQAGITAGYYIYNNELLRSGLLLSTGYVSASADSEEFNLFSPNTTSLKINGLIIYPQIFCEF